MTMNNQTYIAMTKDNKTSWHWLRKTNSHDTEKGQPNFMTIRQSNSHDIEIGQPNFMTLS